MKMEDKLKITRGGENHLLLSLFNHKSIICPIPLQKLWRRPYKNRAARRFSYANIFVSTGSAYCLLSYPESFSTLLVL